MRKGQLSDSTDQAWVQITPKIVQSEALEILEIQDQGWSLQGQHSHLPIVFCGPVPGKPSPNSSMGIP